MTAESTSTNQDNRKKNEYRRAPASEAVYGLGFVGAVVYYLSHATTFLAGALGLLKAIVWPAILVYELLKYLNM